MIILRKHRETNSKTVHNRVRLVSKQGEFPVKISLLLNGLILLIVLVAQPFIQPVIPLFHSLPLGVNQLVPKIWLLLLPLLSIIFNLVHIGSTHLFKLHLLIEKLYLWANVVMQVILLMITLRSILVVM